jgi:hypothetical protein
MTNYHGEYRESKKLLILVNANGPMEIQMNASTTTYYLKMCRVLQG